ncbi:MAG: pyridoxine 5'-phosphate synthase [bacterium]
MALLSVNIDHIATIRQARQGKNPDPIFGAVLVELSGAYGITVHLREDRRHIQDRDLKILKDIVKIELNLEMAPINSILEIALKTKPEMVTLVPEKRKELTTERGLDVIENKKMLKSFIKNLKDNNIKVSLFVDSNLDQIKESKNLGADFIEIHTGVYADTTDHKEQIKELNKIKSSVDFAIKQGLKINAGHGLDYKNVVSIAKIQGIEILAIGHSIISRAVFVGLEKAIKEMLVLIK